MRYCLMFLLTLLFFSFSATQVSAASLLYDSFDGAQINSSIWTKTDTESKLDQSLGYLRIKGGKASAAYADPAIYSTQTFARVAGRAFINVIRSSVSASEGPVMHFSASSFPASPTQTGYGTMLDQTGGDAPYSRFNAVVPGARVNYKYTPSSGYDTSTAKSVDYVTTTVLRDTGSFHFVSGGTLGTYPTATLIWANSSGTDDTLYAGISNKSASAWISQSRMVDLGGDFTSQYGIATTADGFTRSGTLNGSSVDLKGSFIWTNITGSFATDGSIVSSSTSARSVISSVGSEGIIETDMTSPGAGSFQGGLIFRYSDSNNFWIFMGQDDRWQIGYYSGGVYNLVSQTGASNFGNGNTKRMRVVFHGNNICPWANESLVLADCFENSFNNSATGVGIINNSSATVSFDNFVSWPKTVDLSVSDFDKPTLPASGSTTLVSDSFTDTNGVNLTAHTMTSGSGWTTPSGTWNIVSNKTGPSSNNAIAVTEVGQTNMAVSADVTLPQAGVGTSEWFSGVILRYVDGNNYTRARFLWQSGSPEIEIWDLVNGSASANIFTPPGFMNATNITSLLSQGNTKTLKFVVVGNQVAAYMDGTLIVQGTTSRTTGTKAGLFIDNDSVSTPYSTFDNFLVQDTNSDATVPPAVVDTTTASASTSYPLISWTSVYDDAEGTQSYNMYRSETSGQLGSKITTDGAVTSSSYTDGSLVYNGTYYYTVRAVDDVNNESSSADNNQLSFTYTGGATRGFSQPGGSVCTDNNPLGTPNLFQIHPGGSKVQIFFTTQQHASGYMVGYGTTPEASEFADKFDYSGPLWVIDRTISQLKPNTTYYFKVRSTSGCNAGAWSNTLSTKTKSSLLSDIPVVASSIVTDITNSLANICSYTVVSGDNLSAIAIRKWGQSSKYLEILNLNPWISNPSLIYAGQTLKLCM